MKLTYVVMGLLTVALCASVSMQVCGTNRSSPTEPHTRTDPVAQPASVKSELEGLANDANPRVRQKAIELLQECRPSLAAEICPGMLHSEKDSAVILALLDVAGNGKVTSAFEPALRHLQSAEEAQVRAKAAWTIGELAQSLNVEQREASCVALVQALADKAKPPIEAKPATIRAQHEIGLSLACVDALGDLKDPKASEPLVSLLSPNTSAIVRRAVVRCLQGIAQKEQSQALQSAWRSEQDAVVRSDIEQLLGNAPFSLTLDRKKNEFVPKRSPQESKDAPR